MTTLSITLPDDVRSRLEARAAECGFDSVESYVQSLLQTDADPQSVEDEELERLLISRLDTAGQIELTPSFVSQFKEQVAQRRSKGARP